jgi:membrane-bound inhibitor of C-type lysozyme
LTLTLVPAASGAKYADGEGNEFWTKGLDEGLLTLAGEAMRICRSHSN